MSVIGASEAFCCARRLLRSEAIRGHQRPSEASGGHQRPSEAIL